MRPLPLLQMPIGETTSGTIDGNKPVAVFGFDPPEDQTFVVELTPQSSKDSLASVTLAVTGPNGPIDQPTDNASGRGDRAVLVERSVAGSLRSCRQWRMSMDTVHFNLTVRPADVAELPIGGTVSGHLGTSSPFGVFEFEPSAGKRSSSNSPHKTATQQKPCYR